MHRIIKCVIATTLILLLFASIPGVLAGPYVAYPSVDVEWDENVSESPFLPVDRKIDIPLKINFRVTGYFAEIMMPYYEGEVIVSISVNSTPEWAAATILPIKTMILPKTDWTAVNATLSVKVDSGSLAFRDGVVTLEIKSGPFGAIESGVFYIDIPFRPGYLPILNIKPDDSTKRVDPQETASFDIELENLGNAKTKVVCKTMNTPKDWTVIIDPDVILDSAPLGGNTRGSVSLDVKPPYGFGYHNDREIINVSIKPVYYGGEYDSILEGKEYLLSFVVQSKGFSTPGFEFISVFFVVLILIIITRKSKYKKNRKGGIR